VLYHPQFERHFVEYLQRSFSCENLDFWLAAVQYLKTKSRERRKVMALEMLATFFHQGILLTDSIIVAFLDA
jgi:hypothetical protein